jgi:uncharacterized protein (DUF2141 family)
MRKTRVLEIAVVVVGLSVAGLAAKQVVIQTTDVRIGGPAGPLGGGPPSDKPMTTGKGLLMGAVQDAASKRGVAGAIVTLSLGGYAPAQVMADTEGRFAFLDLPVGRYSITATRPGYADGTYGRTRPGGPGVPIDLSDGERMGDLAVPVWKHASIGGTVLDENNDPIVGAAVRVLKKSIVGGKRQLAQGPGDSTDDRGMFRIGGLEPGDYIVALPMTMSGDGPLERLLGDVGRGGGGGAQTMTFTMAVRAESGGIGDMMMSSGAMAPTGDAATAGITEDGHLLLFPTQFYPQAPSVARATMITLASGEERNGIDLQMRPVRTARVSGTLTGPDGPAQSVSVVLSPAEQDDLVTPIGTLSVVTNGRGQFEFKGVPTGSYTLRALRSTGGRASQTVSMGGGVATFTMREVTVGGPGAPLPNDPTLWAETGVTVSNTDITDLAMSLRNGIKVSGTVAFNGGGQKPAEDKIASVIVNLEPADGKTAAATSAVRGRVETTGQFTTVGVPPGRYIVRVQNAPQGWSFLGAMLGGRDVSDEPVDLAGGDATGVMLTFTDQPTELKGVVSNSGGAADPTAAVIVFPTDSSAWTGRGNPPRRIRTSRPAKDGSFTFANLPPGSYLLGAVPDATAPDWQDPRFLETLSRTATRVTIAAGEKKTQNVQSAPVR